MEPFNAQGAAQAIEDAFVLAQCLAGPGRPGCSRRCGATSACGPARAPSPAGRLGRRGERVLPPGRPGQCERDARYATLLETQQFGMRQPIWAPRRARRPRVSRMSAGARLCYVAAGERAAGDGPSGTRHRRLCRPVRDRARGGRSRGCAASSASGWPTRRSRRPAAARGRRTSSPCATAASIVLAALITQGGVESRLRGHVRWAIAHDVTPAQLDALVALLANYVGFRRRPWRWRSCAPSSPRWGSRPTTR